jgi:hypothetical protein
MPCGGGLPKARFDNVSDPLKFICLVTTMTAPPGTPAIRIVPDPTDQIDALGVGVALTSNGTTETWKFTCTGPGQWSSLRVG